MWYFILVVLWCGRTGERTVTLLPKFLGWIDNQFFLLWGSARAPFALAWIPAITTYLNIMSLQSAFTIKEPGRREVEVVTVYNQLPYSVVKFFYQLFLTFTRRYRDRYWMQFHLLFLYRIILTLVNCFSATDSSLTNPHGLYSYRPYPLNDQNVQNWSRKASGFTALFCTFYAVISMVGKSIDHGKLL